MVNITLEGLWIVSDKIVDFRFFINSFPFFKLSKSMSVVACVVVYLGVYT